MFYGTTIMAVKRINMNIHDILGGIILSKMKKEKWQLRKPEKIAVDAFHISKGKE